MISPSSTRRRWALVLLALPTLSVGCERSDQSPPERLEEAPTAPSAEASPAGKATVEGEGMKPLATLPAEQHADFYAGHALAKQPWVKAPTTTTARDGLGPLYNARSCFACHPGAGRGSVPLEPSKPVTRALVRVSVPGPDRATGAVPEPTYGTQIQPRSTALASLLGLDAVPDGEVAPEARVTLRWRETTHRYPDGVEVTLRRPEPVLDRLGYGPLAPGTMMSLRNAPPIRGLGLVEAIPQEAIDALADPQDRDGDGISGRVNQVWDEESRGLAPGRFGLKANQPTLRQQIAAAFAGDVGITSSLFPAQPCTAAQPACEASPSGADEGGVEISDELLDLVLNLIRNISIPGRPDATLAPVLRGRRLFRQAGCASCHQPDFVTVAPERPHLDGLTVWPYSDFLLHDMGTALADDRPDHVASGREWRTPPLWSAARGEPGDSLHLMHDGRAATYEEAILWHGGEARAARDAFVALPASDRGALVRFLESL